MNKIKITKKEIFKRYDNIICVGYEDLHYLLQGLEPRYYTCGVYGWNSDIYQLNNDTIIVTGYRPFGNIKTNNKNGINSRYNNKAYCLLDDKNKLEKLRTEYLKELGISI